MTILAGSFRLRLTAWFGLTLTACLVVVFCALDWFLREAAMRQGDSFLRSEAARMLDLSGRRKVRIMQEDFDRFAASHGAGKILVQLIDATGAVLASSSPPSWAVTPEAGRIVGPGPELSTARSMGLRIRRVRAAAADGTVVVIERSLEDLDELLRVYRAILVAGLALSALAGTFLAHRLAGHAMRRVSAVRQAALDIARGDLSRRVDVGERQDEIRELAASFNDMIERIAALLREVREVTDNVAHELRTPITRIRGTAEALLAGAPGAGEVRETAATVVEECDRLSHLISVMLQIARLESGREVPPGEPVDLAGVVRAGVEAYQAVAEDKGVQLACHAEARDARVRGDSRALQRVLANLLDNAIKYTPSGGRVDVSCSRTGPFAELYVQDTGRGIGEADLPHIFERFYRTADSVRDAGVGLGLCLVRSIVAAHHGTIGVESQPGRGTRFTVRLGAIS